MASSHPGLLQRGARLGEALEAQEVVGGQGVVAGLVIGGMVQVGKFGSLQVCRWRVGELVGWVGGGAGGEEQDHSNACNENFPPPLAILYPFYHSYLALHPQPVSLVHLIVRTNGQQQNLLFAGFQILNELEENPDIVANAASPRSG